MVLDAKRDRLLLHGGDGGPHPTYGYTPLDDLWAYDLVKNQWQQLHPTGDAPKPRWNHAAAVDPDKGLVYVFGGAGYVWGLPILDSDVYVLDMQSLTWAKLAAEGEAPPPVLGPTLTYDPNAAAMLVIGGMAMDPNGEAGSRSVWCLDLRSKRWTEHADKLPTTRRDHVAVYDPHRRQHVIYGGHTTVAFDYYQVGQALRDALIIKVARTPSATGPDDRN